jgi:hypothetical protein
MAGALERVNLVQPADLEEGSRQLHVSQAAIQHVASRGIPLPNPPATGYRGEMPPTLTSLDDVQLGDLLNNVAQWLAYLDGQLAIAEADRMSAKSDLEFRKSRIRMAIKAHGEKRMTLTDKNDLTITDPRIIEAESRHLYTEAIYSMMRAARNKAQQDWETVSRRITQRGQEVERMKREANVAGAPAMARTFTRRT